MKHPIQPIFKDELGTIRFKPNKIVEFLAEGRLNELAGRGFSDEDWEQLAQLIGYSFDGFADLSYVSEETYAAAARMAEGASESDARNAHLRETLESVRDGLRQIVPQVFRIDVDDLRE